MSSESKKLTRQQRRKLARQRSPIPHPVGEIQKRLRRIEEMPLTKEEGGDFGIQWTMQEWEGHFKTPEAQLLLKKTGNHTIRKIDWMRYNRRQPFFHTHCIGCGCAIPPGKIGRLCKSHECQALLSEPSLSEFTRVLNAARGQISLQDLYGDPPSLYLKMVWEIMGGGI